MGELSTTELQKLARDHLWMHNRDWEHMAENSEPMIIVKGSGIRVEDSEGNSWIDLNGGYNSVNVGYGRKAIADAVFSQASKLPYFPAATTTLSTVNLVAKISGLAPGSLNRTFPTSGGSEANETALKVARAFHKRRGDTGRYKIISRRGSYHGATGGVMWLGSTPIVPMADYEPSAPGMLYAPQPNAYRCEFNSQSDSECAHRSAKAIEDLILNNGPDSIAAVIAEPISVPQGAVVPGEEYWPMVREICDKYGVILIADEIVCGFGRTGKMFGVNHWDVVPDIMTVAKGLVSSYLPIGATIVRDEIADFFAGDQKYLRHIFTFSGHPVSAAASLANIKLIEQDNLVENSNIAGEYFKNKLEGFKDKYKVIGDVRGRGLLLAAELVSDRETKARFDPSLKVNEIITRKFQARGIIFRVSTNILNIAPPLSITKDEVDEICVAIDEVLTELESELGM